MDLKEKLDYEREILYLDSLRKSKDAIYTAAEEISCKKKIQAFLQSNLKTLNPDQKDALSNMDNITEAVYRYVCDYSMEETAMGEIIQRWLIRMMP